MGWINASRALRLPMPQADTLSPSLLKIRGTIQNSMLIIKKSFLRFPVTY